MIHNHSTANAYMYSQMHGIPSCNTSAQPMKFNREVVATATAATRKGKPEKEDRTNEHRMSLHVANIFITLLMIKILNKAIGRLR